MDTKQTITANVQVKCTCGKWHKLKTGLSSPIYWCNNELKQLLEGDIVNLRPVVRKEL